jgi:hypothetical protein
VRSFDLNVLKTASDLYPESYANLDMDAWLKNDKNILLEDNSSVALFTFEYPGVYTGHYLFKTKGRDTLNLGEKMLDYMFNTYGANVIRGETPIENKPALFVTRKLGFTSYGINDHPKWGPHEHFILTADEFNNKGKYE